MTEEEIVATLNAHQPAFLEKLGGRVAAFNRENLSCELSFDISTDFCHSGDVVQGGFVTSMLDATMSHAAFSLGEDITNVATLEIKVSFLEASRAGRFSVSGRVVKGSYRTAFLSAELHDANGKLTATATSTAKLVRGG